MRIFPGSARIYSILVRSNIHICQPLSTPSSAAALLSPAAPFTGVKPNIYAYERTKCGSIDLVRAHHFRHRTHIQHTRAIEYSYLSAVVRTSVKTPTAMVRQLEITVEVAGVLSVLALGRGCSFSLVERGDEEAVAEPVATAISPDGLSDAENGAPAPRSVVSPLIRLAANMYGPGSYPHNPRVPT